MYRSARSYSDFLLEFKRFQAFYQSLIGQEKVTPFPVEIELDQLFNFVDKATDTDLVENPQIIDNDVKTLYAIKKRIEEVLHPPDVAPVLTPVYWIEKRNLKKYPYLESTEYALGKAILSGQTSAPDVQGRVKDIRKAMREVKPGDVIFHLINSKCFSGISVASSAVDDTFLWPEEDKPPSRPAYLVRLQNYTELEPPVYKSEFLGNDHVFERLVEISERYAGRQNYPGGLFYDTKNRKIGQGGYLTRAPPEVVDILNEIYKQKSDHHLPHVPPIEHRSWIFQAVPERYNLVEHLPSLGDEPWAANKHQDFMHVGDTIYYWQAGKEAGVYGVGTIVSPLQKGLDTEFGEWSVMTRIGRFLGRRYIPKQAFIDDPVLRHSAIITSPQGTNFLLSSEEADAIKQHMPPPLLPTNEIFYGPPGTGKTYNVINRALELVHDDPDYCKYSQKTRSQLVEEFNLLQKKGQIEFITFHQSYSYEEFVEGIRPVLDSDEKVGGLDYRLKTGVFRNIAERARAADSQNKHFVLVIDEINRGNIPKIFGELITLVEEDKREGCENAISARLPYSGDPFIVPRNLHIIGTMNSADRSIALMDLALRRRFKFIPFGPVYDKTGLNDVNIDGLNLGMLLRRLNVNIQALIDKDHQIGHSFFIKIKDATDKRQKLCDVWYNEIIRLLEEYFYNDYERLSQLLDKYNDKAQTGFIESANLEIKAFLKRNNLDVSDYSTGDVHHYDGPDELIKALISYAKQQSPNV